MITEEEARNLYRQILDVLSQSKLDWIVPQVQMEISKGKIDKKTIGDITSGQAELMFPEETQVLKSNSKAVVSVSEAYSPKEELTILLNALEEISDVSSIRNEMLFNIKAFNKNVISVNILSEDSGVSVTLEENGDEGIFQRLKGIIQQVKSEI